jgi:hypothetical protein
MTQYKCGVLLVVTSLFSTPLFSQQITFHQTNRSVSRSVRNPLQRDLNRDGYPDFVFGVTGSPDLFALMSNSSGDYLNWSIPTQYCPANPLGFGDFQRDGTQDLLTSQYPFGNSCAYNPSFATYANSGSGTFDFYKEFPLPLGAAWAAVIGDFNRDHKLDAVIANGTSQIELHYGNGYGAFSQAHTFAKITPDFVNMIVGDFDANGCQDVAWDQMQEPTQYNFRAQLKVAYGDCSGGFHVITAQDFVGELGQLQTADLNRDGISDIVAIRDFGGQGVINPTIQILYGQKGQTFARKPISVPKLAGSFQVADLDGNGWPDIAFTYWSSGTTIGIRVFKGDSSQAFSNYSTYPLNAQSWATLVAAGDYNRDGEDDIAVLSPIGFTMLFNTTPYASGACTVPAKTGIHVCTPSSTASTTVHVLADGQLSNPAVYMELWVDGKKRIGYGSTHELRGTLTLASGAHSLVYYAYDAAGNQLKKATSITVQ